MQRTSVTAVVALACLAFSCTTSFDVEGDVDVDVVADLPHDSVGDVSPDEVDVPDVTPDPVVDVEPDGITVVRPVDVLFVIDNSMSMIEEQARMTEALPALITGILDPPYPLEPIKNLHLGVVSSDMGTGGFTVSGCLDPVDGDDGVLLNEPNPVISGCDTTYPPFLQYESDILDTEQLEWISTGAACLASLGIDGCGFEQQLEASRHALVDHRDGANAGFIRPDSIVVVVFLSDEDDCSIAEGSEHFFDPDDSSLGQLGLRCYNHPYLVEPVETYIEALTSIHPSPTDTLVAFIVGVPSDAACEGQGDAIPGCLLSEAMEEKVDPATMTTLLPACEAPDVGSRGVPARRFVTIAQELGANGYVQSICSPDYTPSVSWITAKVASLAGD